MIYNMAGSYLRGCDLIDQQVAYRSNLRSRGHLNYDASMSHGQIVAINLTANP